MKTLYLLIAAIAVFACSYAHAQQSSVALSVRMQPGTTSKKQRSNTSLARWEDVSKTSRLEIEIRNTGTQSNVFFVESFFLYKRFSSEQSFINVGDLRIFDYTTTTFNLPPGRMQQNTIESEPMKQTVTRWRDGDKWASGAKAAGFLVAVKDREGNVLAVKAQPDKLQSLIADPARLAEFFAQTNELTNTRN